MPKYRRHQKAPTLEIVLDSVFDKEYALRGKIVYGKINASRRMLPEFFRAGWKVVHGRWYVDVIGCAAGSHGQKLACLFFVPSYRLDHKNMLGALVYA